MDKKESLFKRFLKWLFPWKGDGFGEIVRKFIFLIALIVFLGSVGYFGNYLWQRYQSYLTANKISDIFSGEDSTEIEVELPLPDGYKEKFKKIYQINQNLKGWINIQNTTINYPVVQADNNDYYLRKNFYNKYDINGVPFLDYRDVLSQNTQSDNLVIYGHHMNFSGMFGPLIHYNDLNFYKDHPIIEFDSVYKDMKWKIVGGFYAATNNEDEGGEIFDYQNYIDLQKQSVYDKFIKEVKSRTIVNTGVDVDKSDKFITLSTCANEFNNGRFVVVARQVRHGEVEDANIAAASYNINPKYPAVWRGKK